MQTQACLRECRRQIHLTASFHPLTTDIELRNGTKGAIARAKPFGVWFPSDPEGCDNTRASYNDAGRRGRMSAGREEHVASVRTLGSGSPVLYLAILVKVDSQMLKLPPREGIKRNKRFGGITVAPRLLATAVDGCPGRIAEGFADFVLGHSNSQALLKRADDAVYEAKAGGRNMVILNAA